MTVSPLQYFPNHRLTARPEQIQALQTVYENWDKYDYFVLSLPTGVGKSHVAMAIAEAYGNTYLLTSSLQLQDQYLSTSPVVTDIKGQSNYKCRVNPIFRVDAAPCKGAPSLKQVCMNMPRGQGCEYYEQKKSALDSPVMLTNYVFFLFSVHCGILNEKADIPARSVMIMDEAHTLESNLIAFAEFQLHFDDLYSKYGLGRSCVVGKNDELNIKLIEKFAEELRVEIGELKEKIADEMDSSGAPTDSNKLRQWAKGVSKKAQEKVAKLNSKLYILDKILQPIITYENHPEAQWIIKSDPENNAITMTPLKADFLFHSMLRPKANKFIFMSATIDPDTLCQEIGIARDKILFVETDTPFPPESSPIIVMPKLKMGYKNLEETKPKIMPMINEILELHSNEKGIIHCGNYKIADFIFNASSKHHRRFVYRDMYGSANRKHNIELVNIHTSGNNTVLLSPSMQEGVDLYDELARFQIILKMPWTSLEDFRTSVKSEFEPDWYSNLMWNDIMQSSGRATRHADDYSTTYILDASFVWFYDKWKHRLPVWFKKRIIF